MASRGFEPSCPSEQTDSAAKGLKMVRVIGAKVLSENDQIKILSSLCLSFWRSNLTDLNDCFKLIHFSTRRAVSQ